MDFALLAQTLTIFLSPALPYLTKAGEKAQEEAAKKLGAGTAEKAAEIWRRLRPAVDAKPAAAAAAADVAQDPEDEDLKTALRGQLRKILTQDPELAAALASLLEGAGIRSGDHLELHGSGAIAQTGGTAAGAGGVAVRCGGESTGGRRRPADSGRNGGRTGI